MIKKYPESIFWACVAQSSNVVMPTSEVRRLACGARGGAAESRGEKVNEGISMCDRAGFRLRGRRSGDGGRHQLAD
jgi:hypothetical protein